MTRKQKEALNDAIASAEMEGFEFSKEDINICSLIVDGKLSIKEFADSIANKQQQLNKNYGV